MATKTIAWNSGSGNITLTYNGQGDGTITIESSDNDLSVTRSQQVTVQTTAGSPVIVRTVTVTQGACPYNFKTADGYFIQTADGYILNVQEES